MVCTKIQIVSYVILTITAAILHIAKISASYISHLHHLSIHNYA